MTRDHVIRCGVPPHQPGEGRFAIQVGDDIYDGRLRIDQLEDRLVAGLPDRLVDLIEIAAYVYMADSVISRGGLTDECMGRNWRRNLHFDVPVREPELWNSSAVRDALSAVLGLLSDDHYTFAFDENRRPVALSSYFKFGKQEGFVPREVLLFSGGLDSLAGTLEEVLRRKSPVALVSHSGAPIMQGVQRSLVDDLAKYLGRDRLLHVPVSLHMGKGTNRETTHRSRSFFFAALGIATAHMFGVDRLRFYENGVVSLNLPISGQAVGSRATRSTHPQVLIGFGKLFADVLERPVQVDNPAMWKTKTDIVGDIRDLGASNLIRHTRSCGEVRKMTKSHPHCGACTQCIDRRIAVLAAGVGDDDPLEAYAIDPLYGSRPDVRQRETALGYVNRARQYAGMDEREFVRKFGEIQRAVGFLDELPDAAAKRLFLLHRKHGQAVRGIVDAELARVRADQGPADGTKQSDSLVMLAGQALFGIGALPVLPHVDQSPDKPAKAEQRRWTVRIGTSHDRVAIDTFGKMTRVPATVLRTLATPFLDAKGRGSAPEDFPLLKAGELARQWGKDEEVVRKWIQRTRRAIDKLVVEKGLDPLDTNEIVENVGWRGYRLNPDTVEVRVNE